VSSSLYTVVSICTSGCYGKLGCNNGCQVEHALRVAPLVVIPHDHLDEVLSHDHGERRINGVRVISLHEVTGNQRLLLEVDDALHGAVGGSLDCCVDILLGALLADLDDQVNDGDIGSGHPQSNAIQLALVLGQDRSNCPTYVVGVNEGDYDPENDVVVSNASCTTNGMASVCKVLDESFGVEYGLMTTTHSYTGDQMILDGRHRDLRRARAGACNIVPTSTGAAKAVAAVLPKYKGKLNGIALRVPTPNVSIVDLVVKVSKKCTTEDVNAAVKAAADGPMKGIINFEEQPLVSSDFMQTDYSNSVDAALTMVMGEDLVKVVMWYDNEWGYSQRVIDLTAIVAAKLPVAA